MRILDHLRMVTKNMIDDWNIIWIFSIYERKYFVSISKIVISWKFLDLHNSSFSRVIHDSETVKKNFNILIEENSRVDIVQETCNKNWDLRDFSSNIIYVKRFSTKCWSNSSLFC